ncbi:MAG TPA: sugar phosphate isomerase/epimerase family protein [Gemmataceae bacterium]|nr:sugar phosphate isomerase/epimerase family protein [Gemmataceae bacterium]
MNRLKLGIRLESLGVPLRRALQEVQRLGVTGVQVDAVGDLAPNRLSQTGRREFKHLLRSYDVELTALGCPLRRGLDTIQDQQPRIEHVRKVLSLSFDLGPRLVVVQAGKIPEDAADPRAAVLSESLRALGQQGDRTGTTLALETGLEFGAALGQFLGLLDTGGLGVNFDPANLLLHGFDPYESGRALRGKIVHVHAKDARSARASRAAQEVPVGHGDIDWLQLVGVLEELEYRGWIVIEQESGDNRLADVVAGVKFLRRLLGPAT